MSSRATTRSASSTSNGCSTTASSPIRRYSLVMPLVSSPLLLLGEAVRSPEWWAAHFNVFVVAAGAVGRLRPPPRPRRRQPAAKDAARPSLRLVPDEPPPRLQRRGPHRDAAHRRDRPPRRPWPHRGGLGGDRDRRRQHPGRYRRDDARSPPPRRSAPGACVIFSPPLVGGGADHGRGVDPAGRATHHRVRGRSRDSGRSCPTPASPASAIRSCSGSCRSSSHWAAGWCSSCPGSCSGSPTGRGRC